MDCAKSLTAWRFNVRASNKRATTGRGNPRVPAGLPASQQDAEVPSDCLKEHAWKLIPLARADGHRNALTHVPLTTVCNNDLLRRLPVNHSLCHGFRGSCDTVLTQDTTRLVVAKTCRDCSQEATLVVGMYARSAFPITTVFPVVERRPASKKVWRSGFRMETEKRLRSVAGPCFDGAGVRSLNDTQQ